jgi:hypothetical protein
MAHQISVFAENKPGRISRVTGILETEGINIRAMTLSSSGDFGIIKLLVDQPDKALRALSAGGLSAYKKEILAILMDDRPGGLNLLARTLEGNGINIEDAYGFVVKSLGQAVFVVEVDTIPEATALVAGAGLPMLTDEEIYAL